jgi:hypothetical protein
MVLLGAPFDGSNAWATSYQALKDLRDRVARPISLMHVTDDDYEHYDCPLHREVRRDGVWA